MLKIDIHTHILPERWPDLKERYGYGGFLQLEHHGPGCARMLQYMIGLFGSNRIAPGSDYPFPLGEHHPGKMIEEMTLDDNTRSNLLADAALEWLALKREEFE